MGLVIGIDPGAGGGICFDKPDGEIEVHTIPETPRDTCDIIAAAKAYADMNGIDIHAYIEQVGGYINGLATGPAMFNFGRNFGQLEGFLLANGVPFTMVLPKKWQSEVGARFSPVEKGNYSDLKGDRLKVEKQRVKKANQIRKRDNKNKLKELSQRLYPKLKSTLKTCDAILIFHYGKQQNKTPP